MTNQLYNPFILYEACQGTIRMLRVFFYSKELYKVKPKPWNIGPETLCFLSINDPRDDHFNSLQRLAAWF